MSTLKEIPEGFQITGVDIRGDTMYIEGHAYGEINVQTIPIKIQFNEEDQDDRGTTTRTAA